MHVDCSSIEPLGVLPTFRRRLLLVRTVSHLSAPAASRGGSNGTVCMRCKSRSFPSLSRIVFTFRALAACRFRTSEGTPIMMKSTIITYILATAAFALPPPHNILAQHKPKHSKWVPASTSGTDRLAAGALLNVQNRLHSKTLSYNDSSACTADNVIVRREWSTLRPSQQRAYVRAVRCLQSKPSISGDLAPGARNRYDDFVATHINQTLSIHSTGNFLTWHRYYV